MFWKLLSVHVSRDTQPVDYNTLVAVPDDFLRLFCPVNVLRNWLVFSSF
jgi:hypothetical protein